MAVVHETVMTALRFFSLKVNVIEWNHLCCAALCDRRTYFRFFTWRMSEPNPTASCSSSHSKPSCASMLCISTLVAVTPSLCFPARSSHPRIKAAAQASSICSSLEREKKEIKKSHISPLDYYYSPCAGLQQGQRLCGLTYVSASPIGSESP